MADVNGGPGSGGGLFPGSEIGPVRDRGQMLLVAAFGVAVMLVVLALILNTAIYTENIATRGSDISGGKDAARYRASTAQAVGGAITYVNYHDNATADSTADYVPLTEPVRWSVWNYSNISGPQQATDSVVSTVDLKHQSEGTRLYQNRDGHFSSESDDRNWTVVEDTDGVRNLTLDLSPGLAAENPSDVSPTQSSTVFFVNFTDSSDPGSEWVRVYVFNDSTSDETHVKVYSQGPTPEGTCSDEYDDGRISVDVTRGLLNGTRCEALDAVGAVYGDDFDLLFNDTQDDGGSYTIDGRYTLVTNQSYSSVTTVSSADPLPDKTRAIYSTTVHIVYESKRLYFETDVRVAPGEPDA